MTIFKNFFFLSFLAFIIPSCTITVSDDEAPIELLDTVDYQFYYGKGGDIMIIGLKNKEKEDLEKMTGIEFEEVKSKFNKK